MANLDDLDALVELRLGFSREVGNPNADMTPLAEATREYLAAKIPTGEYRAWVAEVDDGIVAVSGLVLFENLPRNRNLSGLEAYITNMYTIPEWRGKGVATGLLREILTFVKGTDARRAWLRATEDGRPIYEKAGFDSPASYMEVFW